ncbi:hypothetical protein BJY01DRAFT_224117 [Aspergillus pseudoustus]|uniref:RRM domain-containing protein n=1 Tax=Aspergillus pseudoustus TaxID=1810923 RepID=A0ABR4J4B3_9EURO
MYFLRRTACRHLSSPNPLPVRSKLAAISSPHYYSIQRRTISHNRWLSDEVKNGSAFSDVTSDVKTPSTVSKMTPATTTAVAEILEKDIENDSVSDFDVDYSQIREAAEDEIEAEEKRLEDTRWEGFRRTQAMPKSTIFIGNLFYDLTAEDLKKHMSKFGVVHAVNIIYDSRGISKGFGYVQFDTWHSAKKAIEAMNMKIFQGRRVTLYYAHSSIILNKEYIPPTKVLYIGNVPFEMTDRDLNLMFADIMNVIDVRVSMDRRTGQFQGYLHAEFTDVQSATVGLEKLALRRPYGRRLKIMYSNNIRISRGTNFAKEPMPTSSGL